MSKSDNVGGFEEQSSRRRTVNIERRCSMGFRVKKSFKIAKGVKLNVGKKSAGISVGGKHGGISMNSKYGTHARASIPGTGISYTTKLSGSQSTAKKSTPAKRSTSSCARSQYTSTDGRKRTSNPPKPPKSPKIYLPCGIIMAILGVLMLFLFWPLGLIALGIGIYYITCGPKIYKKLVENYKAVHPEFDEDAEG